MEKIKKFNEFMNENLYGKGFVSNDTAGHRYDDRTERGDDHVIVDGVERVDFTDRNGMRHKDGYKVRMGDKDTLQTLILRLIKKRGPECDLNDVDVSNVKDMGSMFFSSDFNGDISGWDVSNVTNMNSMFYKSGFTGKNGSISKWDVSGVTSMVDMFRNSSFNGDISGWDVSNVENMELMFDNSQFNGDISGWDVSKVENMNCMFDETPLESNPPAWYSEKK